MDVNPISTVLATPTSDQDSLSPLAEEDADMQDDTKSLHSNRPQTQKGVRIDDHYYFADEEPQQVKKKTPKGLSDYQAAWYISDSNDSDVDDESELENEEVVMEDVSEGDGEFVDDEQSEMGDTASEMHVDLSPEEEARQYPPPNNPTQPPLPPHPSHALHSHANAF